MENLGWLALVLLVVYAAFNKIKSFLFKAKDQALVKEDEALKSKQGTLQQEADKLKEILNKPVDNLNPAQIEDFWKDDKK